MALKNEYLKRVFEEVQARDKNEPEFLQTVEEVFESLEPVMEKHPEYEKAGLMERIVELYSETSVCVCNTVVIYPWYSESD